MYVGALVCTSAHVYACLWRLEVSLGCCSSGATQLVCRDISLSQGSDPWLGKAGQLVTFTGLSVPASSVLGPQVRAAMTHFFWGAADQTQSSGLCGKHCN